MKLLAIDTSTEACSAALLIDGRVLEDYALAPREHAQRILAMVDGLLAGTQMRLHELNAIAFARGPGAFTGLRIAAALTQGLAFGAGLPVLPVSTLAALAHAAWRLHGATRVLSTLDARMQQVYWGAWEVEGVGKMRPCGEEAVLFPADVPPPREPGWFAAGPGWGAYDSILAPRFAGILSGRDVALLPRAHDVALIGAHLAQQGGLLPPAQAQPVYLRDQVAVRPGS